MGKCPALCWLQRHAIKRCTLRRLCAVGGTAWPRDRVDIWQQRRFFLRLFVVPAPCERPNGAASVHTRGGHNSTVRPCRHRVICVSGCTTYGCLSEVGSVWEARCRFLCVPWNTEYVRARVFVSAGTHSCVTVASLSVTMPNGVCGGQLYTISMFSCDIGA